MSKENAQKFYEALKTDKALAEEMQNALKTLKIETQEQAQKALVEFAGKKGFAFTVAELAELETEAGELDDDDLDKVNAAGNGIDMNALMELMKNYHYCQAGYAKPKPEFIIH